MTKKIKSAEDIQRDKHNANTGTDRGREAVGESVARYKAGRSVVTDHEGRLIAGDKTFTEWVKRYGPDSIQVVETDGSKLLVHQRVDLDLESEEDLRARGLAFADNRSAELGLRWDPKQLAFGTKGQDVEFLWGEEELERIRGLFETPNPKPVTPFIDLPGNGNDPDVPTYLEGDADEILAANGYPPMNRFENGAGDSYVPEDRLRYDVSNLPDAPVTQTANIGRAYLLYISSPDEDLLKRTLECLSFGTRTMNMPHQRQAHLDASEFIDQWEILLGTEGSEESEEENEDGA